MEQCCVEKRQQYQCDHRADCQSAHDRDSHGAVHGIAYQRDHADDCRERCHQDRAHARHGRFDDCVIRLLMFFFLQAVDFVDQHDGIFHHHPDQSHYADNCHEREWLVEHQQCRRDAAKDEGEAKQYQYHFLVVVPLLHNFQIK